MIKSLSVMAGAALVAGLLVAVPGMSRDVEASTPAPGAKADRLDFRMTGPACSQRGWPYYEANCLRDASAPTRTVKSVRLVTTDRLR